MKTNQFKINRTQELTFDEQGNRSIQISQSIELTRTAIEAGFFKDLPGNELSLYLYLLTHVGQDFSLTTNPTVIASLLPCTPREIERGLRMLEHKEYISIDESPESKEQLIISLDKLPTSLVSPRIKDDAMTIDAEPLIKKGSEPVLANSETPLSDHEPTHLKEEEPVENEIVTYLLQQKVFSEEDLVRAISSMIPAQNLNYGFRQELDYWFKTFDKEVIKELIRRTEEARLQRDPEFNSQAYMRKIANDWIAEEIFTIQNLKESDKLYRETRSLIEEYGIGRFSEITRTHWRTIHNWINAQSAEDFALSTDVARYAIQQAILRSSSGRPSLNYIEDNYIKPFKENKIKNVKEAEKLIAKRSNNSPNSSNSASKENRSPNKGNTQQNKWQLGVDFTRFREN